MRYSILDPTGNITALVETPVEVTRQPDVATAIMARHPEVEQVGFVRFALPSCPAAPNGELRMAGGEFCGNASMCAAALYHMRKACVVAKALPSASRICATRQAQTVEMAGLRTGGTPTDDESWSRHAGRPDLRDETSALPTFPHANPHEAVVTLRVSGAAAPVEVHLCPQDPEGTSPESREYQACIRMPFARSLGQAEFAHGAQRGTLPVVEMEGITHLIVEPGSTFFSLLTERTKAEQAIRAWCATLGTDGLGLMFLERGTQGCRLTPLVFVPGSDTVFWENSCASGSSAVGMYVACQGGAPCDLELKQPGGTLRVQSDPATHQTVLHGTVRILAHYEVEEQEWGLIGR